jgi:uncharacterized Zn finger protein
MESIKFQVQGSASEPYEVVFSREGSNLTATCTCPAGLVGQYCKHRFNILGGAVDGVVSNNENEVATVLGWLPGTDVEAAMNAVAAAEAEVERAKKAATAAKKALASAMRD